jgi:hypothetical protein
MALTGAPDKEMLRQACKIFNGLDAFLVTGILGSKLRRLGIRSLPAESCAAARARPFRLTRYWS